MIADRVVPIGKIYPSPGIITEELNLFFADGLTQSCQELDDDEFINVEWWPIDRLEESMLDGSMVDAKTICAYQIARTKGLI